MTTKTTKSREAGRGRPRPEAPPARKPTPTERRIELQSEADQAAARLRRARTRANALRNADLRGLQAELSGRLPEHAKAKLEAVDLRLQEEVADWLRSLAGQGGDAKQPPTAVAVAFLVDTREGEYREWLGEQLKALADSETDSTFSSRSRSEIEADLARTRAEIEAADAEVAEAERGYRSLAAELHRLGGRVIS